VALAFDPRDDPDPAGTAALDAYSMVVTTVAERMLRSVAGLRVVRSTPRGPRAAGGGSAVVLTPDGHLLTSAHSPTSPSSASPPATSSPPPWATPRACGSASSSSRWAPRSATAGR